MKKPADFIKNRFKGKRARIIVSCVASFCLVMVAVILITVINSSAKVVFISDPKVLVAGDYTDSPSLADALNNIFAGDLDLMYGTTEYYYPIGSVMDNKKMFTVTSKSGKKCSGYQCYIYANAAYNKLFGEYVAHGTGLVNSENVLENKAEASYQMFKNAGVMCGAYMRTTGNADGSYNGSNGHSLIILKYDENEITYFEGNGEGQGLVRGAVLSWKDFNARQVTGRNRKICHITQPKASYFNSLYGSSYVKISYSKGNSTSGSVPASVNIKYRQMFTVADKGSLSYNGYDFYGWSCRRTDLGLIANTAGGWSTQAEISGGAAEMKIFKPGEVHTFSSYFFNSGGVHMQTGQGILFYPEWAAEATPAPTGPFTVSSSCVKKAGNTLEFYIDVSNNPGCAYLELVLDLPEGVTVDSVENGEVLGGMYAGEATDIISWKMAGDLYGTGRLVKVILKTDGKNHNGQSVGYEIISCCGMIGDVEVGNKIGSAKIN